MFQTENRTKKLLNKKEMAKDLFGIEIIEDVLLRDKFIEPTFTVLDTKQGGWQNRKKKWFSIGLKSEVGRKIQKGNIAGKGEKSIYRNNGSGKERTGQDDSNSSIFDPALCEVLYHWFCPDGGKILDPFAGGSVRGIVANYLGYKYTGIELRGEQVESNIEQSKNILPQDNQPYWYIGDSDLLLNDKWIIIDEFGNRFCGKDNVEYDFETKQQAQIFIDKYCDVINFPDNYKIERNKWREKFDMIFSCPPYMNLEVYSDDENDLSNMTDENFIIKYESIIKKSCELLTDDGYAVFVVGDLRDKNGFYKDFLTITKQAFYKAGLKLYNEAILLNQLGTSMMRCELLMRNKKLVKVHQNILVFKRA